MLKSPLFESLFALKTFTAAMLALFLSMWLGLENPSWAMMCVYIIALPFSGMALVKGVARLLGTLFGGIACMILLLALHNTPLLHLLALALWLGTCLALSLLERSASSNSSSRCWFRWKSDSCIWVSHCLPPCRPNSLRLAKIDHPTIGHLRTLPKGPAPRVTIPT